MRAMTKGWLDAHSAPSRVCSSIGGVILSAQLLIALLARNFGCTPALIVDADPLRRGFTRHENTCKDAELPERAACALAHIGLVAFLCRPSSDHIGLMRAGKDSALRLRSGPSGG